ncbi:hypothetical protein PN36_19550 [Candidatus Thiomargarita nelsonii]|uniref:Helix-turn-helix domain-containing protein n=1 Tax=Candidatus Thiomargarita nelsonii TaxID=1003181 RepID=A0A0A6S3L5_9GAMM|nr:hypothetical protein PN36_19550 [Candidatus Thiomargarita nelsonii]
MCFLSIFNDDKCEASERFGLSRARLYKLLNQGALVGHISPKKDGQFWIYPDSLQDYSNGNKGLAGRPQVESEGRLMGT